MCLRNLIFSLLATVLTLSTNVKAQDLQTELSKSLSGSVWEGTYSVPRLNNITGAVRIGFLQESSAKGGWQYFHKTQSEDGILKKIASVDLPCLFTPRTLLLQRLSNAKLDGTISVYNCAPNEAEEINLESDKNRKPLKDITVTNFALSNNGNSIEINAIILNFNVVYHLERKTLDAGILPTKETLRSWVESLPPSSTSAQQ